MKKILGLLVLFGATNLYALGMQEAIVNTYSESDQSFKMYLSTSPPGYQKTPFTPICSTRTLAVFDIYVAGGSTTTTSTFQGFTDSGAWVQVGGLNPGTTYARFLYANQNTFGEFKSYWESVSTNTPGVEGGVTIVLRQGAYDGNFISSLTVVGATNVHSSTNTVTFFTVAIIGITYTIPATSGERNYISSCDVEATFASGLVDVTIYDGTAITDYHLKQRNVTTLVTNPLNIGDSVDSYIFGSVNTAMRIDVVNKSGIVITANKINITGFTKQ